MKGVRISDQAGKLEDVGLFANSDELRSTIERFVAKLENSK
jgi:hypothetical protein